jgi:hypothetical protein
MKIHIYSLVLLLIAVVSMSACRKFDTVADVEIRVKDSWDKTPIENARVDLLENQGGYWVPELVVVQTEYTSELGATRFERLQFHNLIGASNNDYIPYYDYDGFNTDIVELIEIEMNPETWLKMTVQDTGMANPNVESIQVVGAGVYTAFYNVEDGEWRIRKPDTDQPLHELEIEVNGEFDYNYTVEIELLRFDTLELTINY